jgi:hypothetical protein
MSDLTAHDLAVTLAAHLEDSADAIEADGDAGCAIDRVVVAAGSPSLESCNEIAVWVNAVGFADLPNQSAGIEQSVCAGSSWVELVWRLSTCITVPNDGRTPPTVTQHLADALCFNVYAFGLYQRLMVDPAAALGVGSCKKVTAGQFDVRVRSGGRVFGEMALRVQVDLVRATS